MNGTVRTIALGLLSCLISACYQTYTGIYFLSRSHEVSRAQAEEVADDLAIALGEFGFVEKRQTESNPMVSFASGGRAIAQEFANLAGSDASINVAIGLDRPSITIRDLTSTEETEFTKALKRNIEGQLEANGISGARFERQKDFLLY